MLGIKKSLHPLCRVSKMITNTHGSKNCCTPAASATTAKSGVSCTAETDKIEDESSQHACVAQALQASLMIHGVALAVVLLCCCCIRHQHSQMHPQQAIFITAGVLQSCISSIPNSNKHTCSCVFYYVSTLWVAESSNLFSKVLVVVHFQSKMDDWTTDCL